jgi:hypothetical protein
MTVAHRGFCDDFTPPTTAAVFSPFYGKYARGGAPTDYTNPNGTYLNGTNTTTTKSKKNKGKGNTFDPRLYEAPPQKAPKTSPPPGTGTGGGTQGGGAAPPA